LAHLHWRRQIREKILAAHDFAIVARCAFGERSAALSAFRELLD
jgi:hypothetical protein